MDTRTLTLAQARTLLDTKEVSARELCDAYLARIAERNDELNAYLEVFDDAAAAAEEADARIARGEQTPLTGIPLAIKDNILIHGKRATSASRMLEQYTAAYEATAIARLKEQGSVFLGRTNMDEFALGSSTENSAYGPTRNPHDETRVPGGSSGGSAAAVADGLALAALGSDTGGSIRQPAALCGLVGFKPSYGAVSRYGLMAAASSFDQIGPLARTVTDAEQLFTAIQGADEHDATSIADYARTPAGTQRIGVPRAFLTEGVDGDVVAAFDTHLEALARAGYDIVDIELPSIAYSLAAYYIINPAEVSTNLARFDGVRYGLRVAGDSLADDYMQSRGQGFGAEVRRRILTGTFVLSSGYADAYYRKAAAVRNVMRDEFARVHADIDAIATPTSPTPAFALGEKTDDPVAMYAADRFTVPVNLAGVPALSVPMGTVEREGTALPIGMQFIGAYGTDTHLFALGREFEKMRTEL